LSHVALTVIWHGPKPCATIRWMSHCVLEEWRGEPVETLEDLLHPGLRAVVVGINPAPVSVKAGHYYQGKLGQAFFSRLRRAGLIPNAGRWEDDAAFASGIGFTDIVKRPTSSASEISADELAYGKTILLSKLELVQPQIAVFTFKKSATVIFGSFAGFGFVDKILAGADVFVMPGPYERADRVDRALAELAAWWRVPTVRQ
jgi:double-stranded uracil-DNA glycosylase